MDHMWIWKSQELLLGFGLVNQKDRIAIHYSEEDWGKPLKGGALGGLGGDQELRVGHDSF